MAGQGVVAGEVEDWCLLDSSSAQLPTVSDAASEGVWVVKWG